MQLRRRGRVHLSLDQHSGEYDRAFSERLPDSKPGPEEIYFSSGAHDWLANGVKQLSPTLRRTLQLRDIDGLTTKEAALVLGVPEGTVKAQISRARAKLVGLMRAKPDGRRLARQSTENLTKLA